jgi:hypothetical protein
MKLCTSTSQNTPSYAPSCVGRPLSRASSITLVAVRTAWSARPSRMTSKNLLPAPSWQPNYKQQPSASARMCLVTPTSTSEHTLSNQEEPWLCTWRECQSPRSCSSAAGPLMPSYGTSTGKSSTLARVSRSA